MSDQHRPDETPSEPPAFPPQSEPWYPPGPPGPPPPGAQGQGPYGQAPYAQGPYGQAPYTQGPYGQAPYPQAPYGPPPGAAPSTNNNALVSLIVGVVSIVACQPIGLVAFFLGRSARKEIAASQGREGGDGLAVAGQIIGMVAFAIFVLTILAVGAIFLIAILGAVVTSDGPSTTSF